MYEILEYDSTLELLDDKGETAIFRKLQRVKFRQDNIIAFQDYAWGEGDIFADYQCALGVVVDRYRESDRWNILISLHETKSKGDITDFYIERTVKHGYVQNEEWQQIAATSTRFIGSCAPWCAEWQPMSPPQERHSLWNRRSPCSPSQSRRSPDR